MIRSDRLHYERFEVRALDELTALFRDEDVRRYLLDDMVVGPDWVEEEIAASDARFDGGSLGLWSVRSKPGDPVIGFVGFRPFFDPPRLQLLYGFLREVWGRGFATEAAEAACRVAFEDVGFDRIEVAVDVPNTASVRVLERIGFTEVRRTSKGEAGTSFHEVDRGLWETVAG